MVFHPQVASDCQTLSKPIVLTLGLDLILIPIPTMEHTPVLHRTQALTQKKNDGKLLKSDPMSHIEWYFFAGRERLSDLCKDYRPYPRLDLMLTRQQKLNPSGFDRSQARYRFMLRYITLLKKEFFCETTARSWSSLVRDKNHSY